MSSSTSAALKAYLEQQGLGVPVFRLRAPQLKVDGSPQGLPYIVVIDGIADAPERTGDDRQRRTTELLQVDVYEDRHNESPTLAKDAFRSMDGAKLPTSPQRVYRVELQGRLRFDDPALDVIRNTITVAIRRKL